MTLDATVALVQVILVDLVLAADNAIAVGMAAAGLPAEMRRKAIILGIGAAAVMRIGFALATVALLKIPGILLFGGLLLLWVCWKLYGELRQMHNAGEGIDDEQGDGKTFRAAIIQIVVADISMSLDNVLAVAGIARDHTNILIIGLVLAVLLMGVAATYVASLLKRYPWIAWVGLVVIVYVAASMIWDGSHQLLAMAEN